MKKKILLIGGGVLAFIVLLILILSLFASNLVESRARAYLKKNPPKGFVADFEGLSVRLWSRTIKVSGITLVSATDSASIHKPGFEPMNLQIESIKLSGISIIKAVKGEHFRIKKIEIIHPKSHILTEGSVFNAKETVEKGREARFDTTRRKPFKSLEIGDILILDGELAITDSNNQQKLLTARDLFVDFKDVYMDSSLKYFKVSEIDIDIKDSEITLPGDLYQMKFDRMQIAKHDSTIFIDSLQLIPLYPRYKFAIKVGKATDRFTVGMGSLHLSGVNFDSILMLQKPIVRLVEVNDIHASIFRDKNMPFDRSNYPMLPHQGLRTMKKDITLEEVRINNGYVEYIEHEIGAEKPGMVFFDQINGSINNITSDSVRIIDHPAMVINASLRLYGQGILEAYIQMPLNDPDDNLTFKARVSKMEMGAVNNMLKPGYLIDISSGTVDDLTVSGYANRYVGRGNMTMLYHGLAIDVLKEKQGGEIKRRWLISAVATGVVKANNPVNNKPVRIAPMYFERDMNKGILNFLWKTCFSGIKESLLPSKQKDQKKKKSK